MSREVSKITQSKTGWGAGPWMFEPDEIAWTDDDTGMACCAKRNQGGAWCGYVGVPKDHKLYGLRYDRGHRALEARWLEQRKTEGVEVVEGNTGMMLNILSGKIHACPENVMRVHGGITYTNFHDDLRGRNLWWFGFDCAHYNDLAPKLAYDMRKIGIENSITLNGTYRDLAYVKAECAALAKQLDVRDLWGHPGVWQAILNLYDYLTWRKRMNLSLKYWAFRINLSRTIRAKRDRLVAAVDEAVGAIRRRF